jgi:hypothetical protein
VRISDPRQETVAEQPVSPEYSVAGVTAPIGPARSTRALDTDRGVVAPGGAWSDRRPEASCSERGSRAPMGWLPGDWPVRRLILVLVRALWFRTSHRSARDCAETLSGYRDKMEVARKKSRGSFQ